MSYYVLSMDAQAEVMVKRGDKLRPGQPVGRSRGRGPTETNVAPESGTVVYINLDAARRKLLVFVEREQRAARALELESASA